MTAPSARLLGAADLDPVHVVNEQGVSPFLFLGDHAGRAIPAALGDLGLAPGDIDRHIAWDIGIAGLGERLSARLDAPFLSQRYSRLVIDCNRRPDASDAMPPVSDGAPVPANTGLTDAARAARVEAIHAPYQDAIAATLARRAGRETILIALHSFTPALCGGPARPWQVGVLHHGGDPRFALALLDALKVDAALTVGDNEPYRMDLIDHTIPRHAYPTRLPYAEIEVRQDLLADAVGEAEWAARLANALAAARAQFAAISSAG